MQEVLLVLVHQTGHRILPSPKLVEVDLVRLGHRIVVLPGILATAAVREGARVRARSKDYLVKLHRSIGVFSDFAPFLAI